MIDEETNLKRHNLCLWSQRDIPAHKRLHNINALLVQEPWKLTTLLIIQKIFPITELTSDQSLLFKYNTCSIELYQNSLLLTSGIALHNFLQVEVPLIFS